MRISLRSVAAASVIAAFVVALGCSPSTRSDVAALSKPSAQRDKVSYCCGMQIGEGMKSQQLDLDVAYVMRGMQDGYVGAPPMLDEKEVLAVMTAFQKEMAAKRGQLQGKPIDEKKLKENEALLAENGKKEGVKTTESGLQYKVLKAGDGPSPKATDTVTVNYRGTYPDGSEFDSSYKRGEPVTFALGYVIPGWTEGLQLMKVGDKFQLWIPSALGYNDGELRIFEVELLGIKPKTDEKK